MSGTMRTDYPNEIEKSVYEKRKAFSDDIKSAFGKNGDKVSRELASYGVEASPPTCRSWINMDSDPTFIKYHGVMAAIEIKDMQKLEEIRARQNRTRSF